MGGAGELSERRDVFISHAHEDKVDVARPLAEALIRRRLTVWLDEYELRIGDSLLGKVDDGLANSTFGVVILSPSFLVKRWPRRELDGLLTKGIADGRVVVLPVWHGVGPDEVRRYSLPLADLFAARTEDGIEAVADQILRQVRSTRVAEARNEARNEPPDVTLPPRVPRPKPPPAGRLPAPAIAKPLGSPSRLLVALAVAVIALLLVLGGLTLYSRSYFVGVDREAVALFQGPPSGFLWFGTRLVERKVDLFLTDLCPTEQAEVRAGIRKGSRSAADRYIAEIRTRSRAVGASC